MVFVQDGGFSFKPKHSQLKYFYITLSAFLKHVSPEILFISIEKIGNSLSHILYMFPQSAPVDYPS